jgi:hypothetical protein
MSNGERHVSAQRVLGMRLCRLMCGRPEAFRQARQLYFGYAQLRGAAPNPR